MEGEEEEGEWKGEEREGGRGSRGWGRMRIAGHVAIQYTATVCACVR